MEDGVDERGEEFAVRGFLAFDAAEEVGARGYGALVDLGEDAFCEGEGDGVHGVDDAGDGFVGEFG